MPRPQSKSKKDTVSFSPAVYLNHIMGLASLVAWHASWCGDQGTTEIKGPLLTAALLPSQRFAIGVPTGGGVRYGRRPFLAVQPEEAQFIKRLCWARAWADRSSRRLVLVTQKVLGDRDTLEDIPAMGFALTLDVEEKFQWLEKSSRLESRLLWFDEDGYHVSSGKTLASIPLQPLSPGGELFSEGSLSQERSLRDLVNEKLEKTNRLYMPYEGRALDVPREFRDLVTPFRSEKVAQNQ